MRDHPVKDLNPTPQTRPITFALRTNQTCQILPETHGCTPALRGICSFKFRTVGRFEPSAPPSTSNDQFLPKSSASHSTPKLLKVLLSSKNIQTRIWTNIQNWSFQNAWPIDQLMFWTLSHLVWLVCDLLALTLMAALTRHLRVALHEGCLRAPRRVARPPVYTGWMVERA